MNIKYRLKPSPVDTRDYFVSLAASEPTESLIDLRTNMPSIYDQMHLGSCGPNALSGGLHYDMIANAMADIFPPARLDLYWKTRWLMGTVMYDSGVDLRTCIKAAAQYGVCPENMWAYSDNFYKFRIRPPQKCWSESLNHKALEYAQVPIDGPSIKTVLASRYPVVIGVQVYQSFESKQSLQTGVVPMPDPSKEQLLGGHALLLAGYDDSKQWYIVRNSWGTSVGDKGYFYMPYDYINSSSLGSDYWVVRSIASGNNQLLTLNRP